MPMLGVMATTRSTGGTNRLAAMEGYLSAHVEDLRSPDDGIEERLRPFITISRQAGAGGHLLAEALLEAFAR